MLKLFRVVPEGEDNLEDFTRPVVFLQHGMVNSAENWVGAKEQSWATKLIEEGYDVWFGNSRGNIYSRGHLVKDPEINEDYNDYSFYEMGVYDLPAAIDYVRDYTGQDKVAYIGYSEGTSSMFTALSENADSMQDKISVFIALAPVMTLKDVSEPFFLNLAERDDQIVYWFNRFGIETVFGP